MILIFFSTNFVIYINYDCFDFLVILIFLDDFKPASMDTTKVAKLSLHDGGEVTMTVPNIPGAQNSKTVFKGSKAPRANKECILVVDHNTGEVTLERLGSNIRLKTTR